MRKFIITLMFFGFFNAHAQTTLSLDDDATYIANYEKKVAKLDNDSAKAYGYLQLSVYSRLIADTVKGKEYLAAGKQLAGKNSFLIAAIPYYEAVKLYNTMNIKLIQNKLMEAEKKLALLNDKNAFTIRGYLWHAYSVTLQMQGQETEATKILIGKALIYAQKSGNLFLIGNVNKSIGIGFMNVDQRDLAAKYLDEAIINIEKSTIDNPIRLETLVETYITAGENDAYRKQSVLAKINLDKANKILKLHPTSNLYYKLDYAQGIYFSRTKQYDKSLQSFEHGIALGIKDPQAVYSVNRLKYGRYEVLSLKNDYKKASLQLEDLLNSPYVLAGDKKMYFKDLAKIYKLTGQPKLSLYWSEKYIKLSDSLYEAKFHNDIMEMEKKYKTAANEKKLFALNVDNKQNHLILKNNRLNNMLLFGSCIILTLTLVAIIIYFKKVAVQKEKNLQQQARELLQTQQIEVSKAMLAAEERERKRMATDLHDGLGGMLAGVKINLSNLANSDEMETHSFNLQKIINQLDNSVTELRNIARNMMPQTLVNFGLETAIQEFCESMMSPNLEIDFEALNINQHIPFQKQATIYRIVQEILTNAIKHANATEIVFQCSQNLNRFYITVEDNGKGFVVDATSLSSGLGLGNIKNRIDYLGGIFDISSKIGEGTIINIELDAS